MNTTPLTWDDIKGANAKLQKSPVKPGALSYSNDEISEQPLLQAKASAITANIAAEWLPTPVGDTFDKGYKAKLDYDMERAWENLFGVKK